MRAVYLHGPKDLRVDDVEPDYLGPGEVRIDVACCGICGTEIHMYTGLTYGQGFSFDSPKPLGHEYAGRISELGPGVTGFSVGERVTSIPGGPCNHCLLCRTGKQSMCPNRVQGRGGAFASSTVVPASLVYHLPDDIPDRLGTLVEPMACAVRAIDRSGLRGGDRVLVIGGGPIGLLIVAAARVSGARTVVLSEPKPFRRELGARLGADLVVDPSSTDVPALMRDLTDGLGADVVFEAVGLPATIEQAIASAAPGGTVLVVGVADVGAVASFKPQEMFFRELTIRGSKGVMQGVDRGLRWLSKLDVSPLITHELPLDQAVEGMELALTGNAGKVLLYP